MPKNELAVVIPVFNEEKTIATVINKWCNELQRLSINYELHVYVAKSTDNTLQILNNLRDHNPNIIIHERPKLGHGPDLVKGYKDNNAIEWIFQIDSDDEIDSKAFEQLWNNKNSYDFLLGRRIRPNQTLNRKITSFISRIVIWMFYGNKVYDVNSPYRLMRTKCFRELFLTLPDNIQAPNLVSSGFASVKKLRVYEIMVELNERKEGTAGLKNMKLLKVAIKCLLETIRFRFTI